MPPNATQLPLNALFRDSAEAARVIARPQSNGRANRLDPRDQGFHAWYRFVLSFPPHLVRDYLQDFALDSRHVILDPFCGTGTTLIEARRRGMRSIGLESNPFAVFASRVKLDWSIDPDLLTTQAHEVAEEARTALQKQGIEDIQALGRIPDGLALRTLDPEAAKLILTNSISPLPLHKTLVLLDCMKGHEDEPYYGHMQLALANALVCKASNLHFGPEVGVGSVKKDTPVVGSWLAEVDRMARDLRLVHDTSQPPSWVHLADARQIDAVIEPQSVDAVITSPPYPNEKDYTRTTRLESVILGFVGSRTELRQQKQGFLRSNTRGVYKGDDDDKWVSGHPEIQSIVAAIERRRRELGKDSGFERMYGRVTQLYFGGMARHLARLRSVLRPGARLAYVVGDQASYLRVMIRTGQLLADIAQTLGYDVQRTDLFRTRFSTVTKAQLREEVVVLRWTG